MISKQYKPVLQSQKWINFVERITIFPLCRVPKALKPDQYCKSSMFLYDGGNSIYECPLNLAHYMKSKTCSKYQWVPPLHIVNMLLGKTNIYINCCMQHLNMHKIKTEKIGWINYVDETGTVYYGTKSGIISRLQKRALVNFKDVLIDSFNFESITIAQSCTDKSAHFVEKINTLSKRVQFLADLSTLLDEDDESEYIEDTLNNFKRKIELCSHDNADWVLDVDDLGAYLQFEYAYELL